jgi:hypothetical protein
MKDIEYMEKELKKYDRIKRWFNWYMKLNNLTIKD